MTGQIYKVDCDARHIVLHITHRFNYNKPQEIYSRLGLYVIVIR